MCPCWPDLRTESIAVAGRSHVKERLVSRVKRIRLKFRPDRAEVILRHIVSDESHCDARAAASHVIREESQVSRRLFTAAGGGRARLQPFFSQCQDLGSLPSSAPDTAENLTCRELVEASESQWWEGGLHAESVETAVCSPSSCSPTSRVVAEVVIMLSAQHL